MGCARRKVASALIVGVVGDGRPSWPVSTQTWRVSSGLADPVCQLLATLTASYELPHDTLVLLKATLVAATDNSFPTNVVSAVGRAHLLNALCQHLLHVEDELQAALDSPMSADSWLLERWSLVVEEAWTAVAMDSDEGLEEGFDQLANAVLVMGFCLETLVERGNLTTVSRFESDAAASWSELWLL